MAHDAAHVPAIHMGLPLPNGKLAMWIFLVTEITFFTALIGTYMLLRNGQPTNRVPWPAPHEVHLVEWLGALNTFVLICSSLTVVLCHWCLHEAKKAADAVKNQMLNANGVNMKDMASKRRLEWGDDFRGFTQELIVEQGVRVALDVADVQMF